MMQTISDWFGAAQGWLFETVIQPLVFQLGFGEYIEEAFEGTEWLMIGVLELFLLFLVLRPMEALIPVHKFNDRRARRNDFPQKSPRRSHANTSPTCATVNGFCNRALNPYSR